MSSDTEPMHIKLLKFAFRNNHQISNSGLAATIKSSYFQLERFLNFRYLVFEPV